MPAMYEILIAPGGGGLFAGTRGNYYELGEGQQIDVQTTPVWCRRCGDFRHGEGIEPLEEIDRRLAELDDPNSFAYQSCFDNLFHEMFGKGEEFRQEQITRLRRRRRWREDRVSPPKCIECGSADIVVLPINEKVPNPAGPGTVEIRIRGMCSTDFNEWHFTPEGERIPRDTKPTHWHHPAMGDEFNKPGGAVEWLRRTGRLKEPGGESSGE